MLFLFRFLAVLPLAVLHILGDWAGRCVYIFRPAYRQRIITNLAQAKVCQPEQRISLSLQAAGQSGRAVMELPKLWFASPDKIRRWVKQVWGFDEAMAGLGEGQGVIFLTPHLGSFELAGQYIGSCMPLTAMYRPLRHKRIDPFMRKSRAQFYANLAPTSLAGVRMLIRALRKGEAIGLLPDQVPVSGEGVWIPFFGSLAYTMTLAPKLALATEARMILTWAERLPVGRGYIINFERLDFKSKDEEGLAREINLAMEKVIQSLPEQYLWSYNRYKSPRLRQSG
ncbi:MAG: lysophospholipid acyltransferase family protein [Pseudomonadota bacterium]|nr:lysophospholipid acyltransferase family protein [Pseudomonadota bacterium]